MAQFKDKVREQAARAGEQARQAYELYDSSPSAFQVIAWVLFLGLVGVLLAIAWINIQPYRALADQMLAGGAAKSQDLLAQLPVIGGLLGSLRGVLTWVVLGGSFYLVWQTGGWKAVAILGSFAVVCVAGGLQFGVGFIFWAVVQTMQTLWLMLLFDSRAIKGAIKRSQQNAVYLPTNASKQDRRMAEKLKRVPYAFIKWSGILALIGYAVDAVQNWVYYPPAQSVEQFFSAVQIGLWGQIDGGNLLQFLIGLLAFEWVFLITLISWQWIQSHKEA